MAHRAAAAHSQSTVSDFHQAQIYSGQMTVSKAITSSGDFTDFANRKKVWLIRANGQRIKLNCDDILNGDAPDPQVYPGDQIQVTRRLF